MLEFIVTEKQCKKCNQTVISALVKCVTCSVCYHKSCAKILNERKKIFNILSENEMECVHHNNASSSHFTSDNKSHQNSCYEDTESLLDLKNIKVEDAVRNIVAEALAPLLQEIKYLREEVRNLKVSNVDLVRMLKNAPNNGNSKTSTWNKNNFLDVPTNKNSVPDRGFSNQLREPSISNYFDSNASEKIIPISSQYNEQEVGNKTSEKFTPIHDSSTSFPTSFSLVLNKEKQTSRREEHIPKPTKKDDPGKTYSLSSLNEKPQEDFQTVISKKNKRKFIRGKAEASPNSGLRAVQRKAYVYVGNLMLDTEEKDLTNFLKSKFPNREFLIEALSKRDNAKSISFKVTLDQEIFNECLKEDLWPSGIIVKKFYFLKKETATAHQTSSATMSVT